LTQNFVPVARLPAALEFLDKQRQSISGFNCDRVKDPYALFVQRMEETYPEELKKAMDVLDAKYNRKSKWELLVEEKKNSGGFSFGFGGGDDSDDD
jgi:hypothetical protein